ncbi:hypothetical protein TVNIR_1932 [Thioalkalivibrio nitratireducens DSM 14787]|uniref:Sulfotransferase domain-containing protein n=2 Tax=Thioalkalivibrio nitratireducens TaxID=186931 RepID=L0DX15_THIND|nr:hypothetical protein TVNIR_1932 [Thioalkalivibrio nitratireducens DSM 14787]
MADSPAHILILSPGKSGSTGLYFKIKNSLESCTGVFEPRDFSDVAPHLEGARPVLVKALLRPSRGFLGPMLAAFDRRIFLVRDPRDLLISALLYTGVHDYLWRQSDADIRAAFATLARKHEHPREVTLSELFARLWGVAQEEVVATSRELGALSVSLADARPGVFVFRYEDFVADRLAELEAYLGFPLQGSSDVGPEFQRVVRTRGSGAWRHWFTPEDVAVFGPLFHDYVLRFGYDPDDWTLAEDPVIERRHAVDYVQRILNERRQKEGLPAFVG